MLGLGLGKVKTHDDVTVNATATAYGPWAVVDRGVSFNAFWTMTGTAPHLNVYLDYTPLSQTIAQTSSDTSLYVSATLASDSSTKTAMQKVATWPAELNQPFYQCRLRFVGTASNGTDTVLNAWLLWWN